jgi:hypothetical protein
VTDRRSSSDLGERAEAALTAFPFPERDWERDARAIEARITSSLRGSTDASLLAAPLPSESDEPSTVSATTTPLTNSGVRTQSLAELARRSVEKKQASERQMARESLALAALAAQQRAKPAQSDANPVPASGVATSAVANNAAAHQLIADRSAQANATAAKSFPKIALAFPALALAAAALLWFRQPESTPLVSTEPAPATPSVVAPSAPAATAIARSQPTSAQEPPRGIDPSTLPDHGAPTPDSETGKQAAVAAAPTKAGTSKPQLKVDRSAAEASDPGLPPDPALRPADSRSGGLPTKPTTGAVQAALGSVMSGARHCVAGDDAPSRAVVVFGSDGRVQQVTVSGSAAGKSSASCIEAQLSRARVQPFAASSFSVNATVRPE